MSFIALAGRSLVQAEYIAATRPKLGILWEYEMTEFASKQFSLRPASRMTNLGWRWLIRGGISPKGYVKVVKSALVRGSSGPGMLIWRWIAMSFISRRGTRW